MMSKWPGVLKRSLPQFARSVRLKLFICFYGGLSHLLMMGRNFPRGWNSPQQNLENKFQVLSVGVEISVVVYK